MCKRIQASDAMFSASEGRIELTGFCINGRNYRIAGVLDYRKTFGAEPDNTGIYLVEAEGGRGVAKIRDYMAAEGDWRIVLESIAIF